MELVARSGVLRSAFALLVGGALGAGAGCGGKSQQAVSGTGGSAAEAGLGGSSGAGPIAGSGGATGGAGSGGKGGSDAGSGGMTGGAAGAGSGAAGGGAAAGAGGKGGMPGLGYPECQTADDCVLQSDCCGCSSVPRDGREFCPLDCERDPCPEMGLSSADVECVYGRCVFARSCDYSAVCLAAVPECPEGTLPSVAGGCWGPCLPPTECMNVGSCSDCGDSFCVEFQAQRSSFHCVTRVQACDRANYCECLGVCGECKVADDAVVCPCDLC
jgi:hypothetical protein